MSKRRDVEEYLNKKIDELDPKAIKSLIKVATKLREEEKATRTGKGGQA